MLAAAMIVPNLDPKMASKVLSSSMLEQLKLEMGKQPPLLLGFRDSIMDRDPLAGKSPFQFSQTNGMDPFIRRRGGEVLRDPEVSATGLVNQAISCFEFNPTQTKSLAHLTSEEILSEMESHEFAQLANIWPPRGDLAVSPEQCISGKMRLDLIQ